jgi:hypothetical protein
MPLELLSVDFLAHNVTPSNVRFRPKTQILIIGTGYHRRPLSAEADLPPRLTVLIELDKPLADQMPSAFIAPIALRQEEEDQGDDAEP